MYTFRILVFFFLFLFPLTSVFNPWLIWSQGEESIRASSICTTLDTTGCGKKEVGLLMTETIAIHIAIVSTQKY